MQTVELNYHDIFTMRGYRMHLLNFLPIFGCKNVGVLDDGIEVLLHFCIGSPGFRRR
jgi:hypothetical protein